MKHSRRSLMRMAAACAVVACVPAVPVIAARKYGRITAGKNDRPGVKCLVDGMDVTLVFYEADDVEGWAKCYEWKGYPSPPPAKPEYVELWEWKNAMTPGPGGVWIPCPPMKLPEKTAKVILRGKVEFQWP